MCQICSRGLRIMASVSKHCISVFRTSLRKWKLYFTDERNSHEWITYRRFLRQISDIRHGEMTRTTLSRDTIICINIPIVFNLIFFAHIGLRSSTWRGGESIWRHLAASSRSPSLDNRRRHLRMVKHTPPPTRHPFVFSPHSQRYCGKCPEISITNQAALLVHQLLRPQVRHVGESFRAVESSL